MKHIAHLLTTANLLTNQNEFGNGIVPEAEAPLEYGVLDKLDIDSEELEIMKVWMPLNLSLRLMASH